MFCNATELPMPGTRKREAEQCAAEEKPKNEDIFRIYLFVVAIMVILALVVPSPVQVERPKLDRLSGQAPATLSRMSLYV